MKYTVQPGDCMASIALVHGFLWETLWNLPENAQLKRTRKDPYVLFPGDQVFIPDLRSREWTCATNARHVFNKKGTVERVRIVLTDEKDKPLANQPYTLEIDRQIVHRGQTAGDGVIEHTIRPNAVEGRLLVGEGKNQLEYHIGLGRVDPIDEVSGVQGRLFNLGYYNGPVDGKLNTQTTTALLLFQDKYGIPPSGEIDKPTQAKLTEIFGC